MDVTELAQQWLECSCEIVRVRLRALVVEIPCRVFELDRLQIQGIGDLVDDALDDPYLRWFGPQCVNQNLAMLGSRLEVSLEPNFARTRFAHAFQRRSLAATPSDSSSRLIVRMVSRASSVRGKRATWPRA